jgi:hypothetical protein
MNPWMKTTVVVDPTLLNEVPEQEQAMSSLRMLRQSVRDREWLVSERST